MSGEFRQFVRQLARRLGIQSKLNTTKPKRRVGVERLEDRRMLSVAGGGAVTALSIPDYVTELTRTVSLSSDDAEERAGGRIQLESSDLELVDDSSRTERTIGVRFQNIDIPPDANIHSARIVFTSDEVDSTIAEIQIAGEASADAKTFAAKKRNLSSRAATDAQVSWTPDSWDSVGASGARQTTPDLANIVAEIIKTPGWESGNAMAFLFTGSGERTAESFDGSRSQAPQLRIVFSTPTATPTATVTAPAPGIETAPLNSASNITLSRSIAEGADDASETSRGRVRLNANQLKSHELIGLRYQDIQVPQGSTIVDARLEFTSTRNTAKAAEMNIEGQLSSDAESFTSARRDISSRQATEANVNWTLSTWNKGDTQESPDLASVIQEIVDQQQWTDGNALALMVSGSGRRFAQSFEQGSAPVLTVTYTTAAAVDAVTTTGVPVAPNATSTVLSKVEVEELLRNASEATASEDAIVAVVDRAGRILGVRVEEDVAATDMVFAIDGAIAKARTASFFSSDQAPLTSRTVRFISQSTITQREVQANPNISDTSSTVRGPGFVAPIGLGGHFPPGVAFTPQVDLFAIEHTNRDSVIHPGPDLVRGTADDIDLGTRFGADFVDFGDLVVAAPESYGFVTEINVDAQARGIATLPGGVPLYKDTIDGPVLVGGIGVFFPGPDGFADFEQGFQQGVGQTTDERLNADRVLEAEYIAFVTADSTTGFSVPQGRIDLVGITLEAVGPHAGGLETVINVGQALGSGVNSGDDVQVTSVATELYLDGKEVPDGWLVEPRDATESSLTEAEVRTIIERGITEAEQVRAAIRLPVGERTRMVLSVADTNGEILGLYRMPDATYFSIDVAVAKARNVAYHADASDVAAVDLPPGIDPGVAFTNRTYRFLAAPYFPSGIDGTGGGDYSILRDPGVNPDNAENLGAPVAANAHETVLGFDAFNPGSNFREATPSSGYQNGVVFFPGSTPLYKDGVLVGGFGVSGDGVDQDDVVTFSGSGEFRPGPDSSIIRADEVFVSGVRLPFQKFLRNPRG